MKHILVLLVSLLLSPLAAAALDYAYKTAEPQKAGWPLIAEERAYVLKPEHERRPGAEQKKHLPAMWPVVPSAGHFGGTAWLDTHAKLVKYVEANKGPIDILLVGDSITQQWGSPLDNKPLNAAWQKQFGKYKTINIGIGGDKSQNVLWRLDHGGVEGLEPRLVVVLIGNNNMFFTPETGVEAAAKGIEMCVANVRDKFPKADVIAVKIFPALAPGNRFYEDIKKTHAALDGLKLDSDPKVRVLDLWNEMVNADGTLKPGLFTPDNIHLTQDGGYELYASKLHPVIDALMTGKPVPAPPVKTKTSSASPPAPLQPAKPAPTSKTSSAAANIILNSKPVLTYPYAPYNEGKVDPQLTGWPLTDAERAWATKEEYTRKPGHEAQKHLPEMWAVTPTASHWKMKDGSAGNAWLDHHAT